MASIARGVGKMRPVRLCLISSSTYIKPITYNVRIWVRFMVRIRVRVGGLIQVA